MNPLKSIAMVIVAVLVLTGIFGSFFIVDTGERALLLSMGKLSATIYWPGIHGKTPLIDSEEEYSVLPIESNYNINVDSNGAITKDNQTIGAEIKAYYAYDELRLIEMRQKYGENKIEQIVGQVIYESFKEVVWWYDIFNIAAGKEELRTNVTKMIAQKLEKYPVILVELKITNYDRSDKFDAQIEETMSRAQEVKQKELEVLIQEQEAQKQVKTAEAGKQSMILLAEGKKEKSKLEAEAKALEGEGIRKYNEEIAKSQELEIELRKLDIEKLKAEKRNGQYVPNNMYWPIPVDTQGWVKR